MARIAGVMVCAFGVACFAFWAWYYWVAGLVLFGLGVMLCLSESKRSAR